MCQPGRKKEPRFDHGHYKHQEQRSRLCSSLSSSMGNGKKRGGTLSGGSEKHGRESSKRNTWCKSRQGWGERKTGSRKRKSIPHTPGPILLLKNPKILTQKGCLNVGETKLFVNSITNRKTLVSTGIRRKFNTGKGVG